MSDEELRQQNNAKIQTDTTGSIGISALLKMAEGNSNAEMSIIHDEITVERSHVIPTPLQMEIRASQLNAEQIAKKYFGDEVKMQQTREAFNHGFEGMYQALNNNNN